MDPGPARPAVTAEAAAALRASLGALGFDDVRFARVDGPVAAPLRAWLDAGL